VTELLPPDIEDPDMVLERLLEASRTIVLDTQPLGTVRLSRFTLKQLSRTHRLRAAPKRRRKQHYHTYRRKLREKQHRRVQKYYRLKCKHKGRWQVSLEEWNDILWPYVGEQSIRIGTYDPGAVMTIYSLWIESSTGERLWEGAEERLRELGATI
jgi:hypothetical protein